jgi:MFS family permease
MRFFSWKKGTSAQKYCYNKSKLASGITMTSLFILAALSASLGFGIGDFLGGRASAKIPVVHVLVISELFGALLFWLLAQYTHEAALPSTLIGLAILTGVTGAIGLAALYNGIARGHTAVTAPVAAALSAIIPVCFGIATSGLPSRLALIGMALGIVAIVLNSLSGKATGYKGLWQGLAAGEPADLHIGRRRFVQRALEPASAAWARRSRIRGDEVLTARRTRESPSSA